MPHSYQGRVYRGPNQACSRRGVIQIHVYLYLYLYFSADLSFIQVLAFLRSLRRHFSSAEISYCTHTTCKYVYIVDVDTLLLLRML